jgi:Skp family chaperone for outer membrane proteins
LEEIDRQLQPYSAIKDDPKVAEWMTRFDQLKADKYKLVKKRANEGAKLRFAQLEARVLPKEIETEYTTEMKKFEEEAHKILLEVKNLLKVLKPAQPSTATQAGMKHSKLI